MAERVSAKAFSSRSDLPDWRVILGGVQAAFTAESFDKGAAFVQQVADAAEAANHHPDVDLRYPGRVRIRLTTHSAGGLTDADVALAQTLSRLAAESRLTSEPLLGAEIEVAIDAMDIDSVRPFWKAVLGYVDDPAAAEGEPAGLVDPNGGGPPFWFQQMDAPRPQRNRLHIDVSVPHDVAEDRVAQAVAAGGTVVNDQFAKAFWVLADAEGNEACISTWQDRGRG